MPVGTVQRWSLSLGRWAGVTVYVHLFFLIFAVLALAFSLPDSELVVAGSLTVAIVFFSVLMHEFSHLWAAHHVDGKMDAIVIGPVGGLLPARVPDEPEKHLFVAIAGPMAHLTLVVLAAITLALAGQQNIVSLLSPIPLSIDLVEGSPWLIAAKLTLWLNWMLMLLNLLPAYPFDGGAVMRAMLWPALGRRTARIWTSRTAMAIAVGLGLVALWTLRADFDSPVPVWIPFVLLGIFLFFSARQDLAAGPPHEEAGGSAGYNLDADGLDLLEAMWASEEEDDGVLVEHQQSRQFEERQSDQEASEDARVDDILARLHDSSMDSLSPEEVAVLQRASRRYRLRKGTHRERGGDK